MMKDTAIKTNDSPNTSNSKHIEVEIKDLYQLLISECRYGYTRNNHLMPGGAFDHARQYLPLLMEKDEQWGIHTTKQLVEECIFELSVRFWNGVGDLTTNDDFYKLENNISTRKEYIGFIEYCFDVLQEHNENPSLIYNYDLYVSNLKLDDEPRYTLIDLDTNEVIDENLSQNSYLTAISKSIGLDNFRYRCPIVEEFTKQIYVLDEDGTVIKRFLLKFNNSPRDYEIPRFYPQDGVDIEVSNINRLLNGTTTDENKD